MNDKKQFDADILKSIQERKRFLRDIYGNLDVKVHGVITERDVDNGLRRLRTLGKISYAGQRIGWVELSNPKAVLA